MPQAVAQLPWGHARVLLDKLTSRPERDWYAAAAGEYGWPRDVLVHKVETRLLERTGSAPSNFAAALPAPDSELAQQLVRDPYVFDHLALSERVAERELEQALMDRLQRTLLAFGHGMAFVGRQVRFDVDGDELVLDLLLFDVEQLRYVVVELKIGRFDPAYVGQLGTCVAVVDDRLRRSERHARTVGILLCKGRNDTLVRYALAGAPAPLAVADYIYDTLPPQERGRDQHLRSVLSQHRDGVGVKTLVSRRLTDPAVTSSSSRAAQSGRAFRLTTRGPPDLRRTWPPPESPG